MKLVLFALAIALALIFDQFKAGGYYRTSALNVMEEGGTRVVRLFR